jgi:hypothetical protein
MSVGAANGGDETGDENQEIGSAGHAGLGEDVIAMRSRRGLGDAECGRGFGEARTGHEMLQEPRLGRG